MPRLSDAEYKEQQEHRARNIAAVSAIIKVTCRTHNVEMKGSQYGFRRDPAGMFSHHCPQCENAVEITNYNDI